MIANNYATVKHIVDLKNKAITPDKILEIHRMITGRTLETPEYEGNFRQRYCSLFPRRDTALKTCEIP
jgi:hypothetical protein